MPITLMESKHFFANVDEDAEAKFRMWILLTPTPRAPSPSRTRPEPPRPEPPRPEPPGTLRTGWTGWTPTRGTARRSHSDSSDSDSSDGDGDGDGEEEPSSED